jgi:transposase
VLPRLVTFTQVDADHDCRTNWRTTAMVMLADHYDYVIGGDPDRDTIDLAVIDTRTGGVQAHTADTADGPGYRQLLAWGHAHAPGRRVWALEGTGSFAAGFEACLAEAGEEVIEVGGVKRARGAKNDRIDAVRAARHALAREHQATPRARGLREAIRLILNTRHGLLVSRTKAINELKAPSSLRRNTCGPVCAVFRCLNNSTGST